MAILKFSAEIEKPLHFPHFDRRVLKPEFRKIGRDVAKISRKLVSRRGVSHANEYPAMQTKGLRKSIKSRVSRSGFSVAIKSDPRSLKPFYPAFVAYGHRGPNTDSEKEHGKVRVGQKVVAPRKNWITDAAEMYGRTRYQTQMREILGRAIKPGLISKAITK